MLDGGPGAEAVGQFTGADDFDVARNHAGLRLDNAVEVGDTGDRVDQAGRPLVAKVVDEHLAHGFDALPGLFRGVVHGHQDLHPHGLLAEIDPGFGKLFGVLLLKDELGLLDQVRTEGGDRLIPFFVQHRGTAGLVVDPVSVVDLTAADGHVLSFDRFDLHLEEGPGIGVAGRVREAGHAVGAQGAAGDGVDHGSVHGVESVLAFVADIPVAGGSGPQNVGLVDVGPANLTDCQAGVQIFDGPEPLRTYLVRVLGTDITARFDQADDALVVVDENHFGRIAEHSPWIVADDVNLCHGNPSLLFEDEGDTGEL